MNAPPKDCDNYWCVTYGSLWESWLRHVVPMNMAEEERISVSFNYEWM